MTIINYVPKETTVRDRRSDKGGYYTATCDECGKTFYPARLAKYCSQLCTQRAYLARKRAGVITPKEKKAIFDKEIVYSINVIKMLKSRYPSADETQLETIQNKIKTQEIDNVYHFTMLFEKKYDDIYVKRISTATYFMTINR